MMSWYIALVVLIAFVVVAAWMLLRRQKNVPVGLHHMPRVRPLTADERPKHFVDETAEFTAIEPGRHATDTAWAMPAVRPNVPRA